MKQELINELIQFAFKEDIGECDHTTFATVPPLSKGEMKLIIKEEGILAGVEIAKQIFYTFDSNLNVSIYVSDGREVKQGDVVFTVEGKIRSLLQTERLVLNVMQRMSGISTITRKYVKKLEGTNTRLLDTRKTTPCVRVLEKEAVRIGGGDNHRMGLFDMILIKDNHVDFAGGIRNAIIQTKKYLKKKKLQLPIEIEVRTFDELDEVLETGNIDRIMLDNFDVVNARRAVERVNGRYKLESSGKITYDTIRDYAEVGIDYISIGALTHSAKSLDMSLKAMGNK